MAPMSDPIKWSDLKITMSPGKTSYTIDSISDLQSQTIKKTVEKQKTLDITVNTSVDPKLLAMLTGVSIAPTKMPGNVTRTRLFKAYGHVEDTRPQMIKYIKGFHAIYGMTAEVTCLCGWLGESKNLEKHVKAATEETTKFQTLVEETDQALKNGTVTSKISAKGVETWT